MILWLMVTEQVVVVIAPLLSLVVFPGFVLLLREMVFLLMLTLRLLLIPQQPLELVLPETEMLVRVSVPSLRMILKPFCSWLVPLNARPEIVTEAPGSTKRTLKPPLPLIERLPTPGPRIIRFLSIERLLT